MNILYITNVNLNYKNGAVFHIKHFLDAVRNLGIDYKLISYQYPKSRFNDFKFIWESILFLLHNRHYSDIVYVRYYPLAFFQIVVSRILNKKIVVEYNSVMEEELKYLHPEMLIIRSPLKFLSRLSCNLANIIVVLSEGIGLYIKSTYHIKNGYIHLTSNAGRIIENIEKSVNRRGLVMMSSMPWYNTDNLLKIRELLKKQNIQLDIYLSTRNIRCNGDTNGIKYNKDIDFSQYDFGLITIDRDRGNEKMRFGIRPAKYFQYLSHGLAVIVPDIPDINSITANSNTGYIYSAEAAINDIVSKISFLYTEDSRLTLMQSNALKLIKKHYNWKKVVNRIIDEIEKIS